MHMNRKKQTISELCLKFHELLQKIYVNMLEVRSPEKALPFFGTYGQMSSVSNKNTLNVLSLETLLI